MDSNKNFSIDSINIKLRKELAAYYTKLEAATLISSIVINSNNVIILDPSCGIGTLLESARNRLNLLSRNSESMSVLLGIEIFEEAFVEAEHLKKYSNKNIFFDIVKGDAFFVISDFKSRYITFNSLKPNLSELENQVIVLANPPFSKSQLLSNEYRNKIEKQLNLDNKGPIGLHCYFLSLIYQILPNLGVFGLILPLSVSYTNRGMEIVKNFFSNSLIKFIILSDKETAFSIDSNFQEFIIIGSKNENLDNLMNEVKIITLNVILKPENISRILELINNDIFNLEIHKNDFFTFFSIRQSKLIETIGINGWNFLYRSKTLNKFINQVSPKLISLKSEKKIQKKRGVNAPSDFFFIPNKYIEIESETKNILRINFKMKNNELINFANSHQINLEKKNLIPLMRKPEYYKNNIIIKDEQISANYCLVIKENEENFNIGLKQYIKFGEKLNINRRSNTSILKNNWFMASSNNNSRGKIFLTFKWDPRYRSFLVNYYSSKNILASQAFWIFILNTNDLDLEQYIVSWFNSTINMAIIYGIADVQRRVWRQLSGSRIDSLLLIPIKYYSKLSLNDKKIISDYNHKLFDTSLINEITVALEALRNHKTESSSRCSLDLIFLRLLLEDPENELFCVLEEFYVEFINELTKILVFS